LITEQNIEYADFVENVYPEISRQLRLAGYQVQPKRGRNNNEIKVMRHQNHPDYQQFLVHFTFFSPEVYCGFEDYVQSQIKHAKDITHPDLKTQAKIVSLEELIPLKLRRCTKFGMGREDLVGPVYSTLIEHAKHSNWGFLANQPISEWKAVIEKMQQDTRDDKGVLNLERQSTYKLSKDIYDICLASRVISDRINEFDRTRFEANLKRILE
jgi:hypothetical protein